MNVQSSSDWKKSSHRLWQQQHLLEETELRDNRILHCGYTLEISRSVMANWKWTKDFCFR
jgi:hypothetical protein